MVSFEAAVVSILSNNSNQSTKLHQTKVTFALDAVILLFQEEAI